VGPDGLAVILETALTRPSALTTAAFDETVERLGGEDARPWTPALATLAAVLYARPDLARAPVVDRLAAVVARSAGRDTVVDRAAVVFEYLATLDLAEPALVACRDLLGRPGLAPSTRTRLVGVLRAFANWRPDLLDVGTVVELAAAPALAAEREAILGHVLEPLVFAAPAGITSTLLDRIADVFGSCMRLRYTLVALGERAGASPAVRHRVAAPLAAAFPHRPAARAVLTGGPFALLVILNVRIGQGDEIVRLAALTQALLDANPRLSVTLVTKRPHLYDHPCVRPVAILDDVAVGAALAAHFDGVVHVSEPDVPQLTWAPELDARVSALVAAQRPRFMVAGDVGRTQFLYQRVLLDGRELARERELDRLGVESIYDGCRRLLAELGLPARAGEEPFRTPCLLTGTPSRDAEGIWDGLRARLAPPIALVNAFGGASRIKGYPADRPERLAAELTGLVAEGCSAVLLPNGTSWGGREAAERVLGRVSPDVRTRLALAPDPDERDPARRLALTERLDLPYADRVMRLFKYFATYADCVATVEGWMAHLVYALGRPYRLVLQAQSYGFDWHPPGRGPRQRLRPALSTGSRAASTSLDALGEGDPPPLPARPRKPLLRVALAGLAGLPADRSLPLLRRALAAEDHDVRAYAVAGLAGLLPGDDVRRAVVAALRDPEPVVRSAAAEALLASGLDLTRELGARFAEYLQISRDIAGQNWPAVFRTGDMALPALFVAADGANDAIRREARWVLRRLLTNRGLRPFDESAPLRRDP
jgi:hypothetical protein